MTPSSLTNAHRSVLWSALYGVLSAAELLSLALVEPDFSSIKTSMIKLLMMDGFTGAKLLDHSTTPDVVSTSNKSNMLPS